MKTIFTALFCTLTLSAIAQQNFVKGYYINAQGDTIHSYIDDQNWIKSPDRIRVKASPEATDITALAAAGIRGFGVVTGDRYVSEVVQIDKSPVNVNLMKVGAAPILVTDTVFLRVLVQGNLNLLYIEDETAKQHYYIQQPGMQPEELRVIKKLVHENRSEYVSQLEVYKETLARMLHNCQQTAAQAYTTDLTEKALTALITRYNHCTTATEAPEYVAEKEKLNYRFGVVAGIMPTTLYLERPEQENELKQADGTLAYTAGLSLNIVLPRARNRWSLYNELAWKTYQSYTEWEGYASPNHFRREKLRFELGYVGLNTMVRYQIPIKGVQPFINVGIANNFSVVNNNTATIYTREYSVEYTREGALLDPVRKYEQALLAGAGLNYKRIGAEVRFENGNGMTAYTFVRTTRRTFNFLVSYSLN